MSKDSKDWIAEVTGYTPTTTQQGHTTVQTGHDRERPNNDSDIGRLYNRMNRPGVAGTANDLFGGKP